MPVGRKMYILKLITKHFRVRRTRVSQMRSNTTTWWCLFKTVFDILLKIALKTRSVAVSFCAHERGEAFMYTHSRAHTPPIFPRSNCIRFVGKSIHSNAPACEVTGASRLIRFSRSARSLLFETNFHNDSYTRTYLIRREICFPP